MSSKAPDPNHKNVLPLAAAPAADNTKKQTPHHARMQRIRHKFLVLSGKGGVGKSTVAVNLAAALAMNGARVGLLDVDLHGPSVPKLLHLEDARPVVSSEGMMPIERRMGDGTILVMSAAFLLPNRAAAVIWRGPRKYAMIRQFLNDIAWGDLDALVVDAPPGTGDEPLAVAELVDAADGAVIVTTPQDLAVQDVRRCIHFCRQLHLPILGIVENMSGFTCPDCGKVVRIFGGDGGRKLAEEAGVPFLGEVPIDPTVVTDGDRGTPIVDAHPESLAAQHFARMAATLLPPQ